MAKKFARHVDAWKTESCICLYASRDFPSFEYMKKYCDETGSVNICKQKRWYLFIGLRMKHKEVRAFHEITGTAKVDLNFDFDFSWFCARLLHVNSLEYDAAHETRAGGVRNDVKIRFAIVKEQVILDNLSILYKCRNRFWIYHPSLIEVTQSVPL